MLKSGHTNSAGFFSHCSVKLENIVKFINKNKKIPNIVVCTNHFQKYKRTDDIGKDITFDYFKDYNNNNIEISYSINYSFHNQWINYSKLDYKNITPLIKKYFSPSDKINEIINNIIKKYNIIYENTLAVYYRGTDKIKEAKNLTSFDDFFKKIIEIININKNIKILIQTDSAEFIDYIKNKNLKNIIIIDENKISYTNKGIHNEQSNDKNYNDMFYFLSTVLIISKCKYIICNSGNCSMWMLLYRGNDKNLIQYSKNTLYTFLDS